jgi:hypothetical protein
MRKIIWSTAAAAIVASMAPFTASVQPTEAAIVYPWCAHYGGRNGGGAPSCGSSTYAQCMATVSGQMGYCDRNPFYQGPDPVTVHRSRVRARS